MLTPEQLQSRILFGAGLFLLGLAAISTFPDPPPSKPVYDAELAIDRAKAGAELLRTHQISDTETVKVIAIPSNLVPGSYQFDKHCFAYSNSDTQQSSFWCD